MIKSMIGLEAEYLLRNSKGKLMIPPAHHDRDDFPLLGEIRGYPGKTIADVLANFSRKKIKLLERLKSGQQIGFIAREKCPLALYKEANKIAADSGGKNIGDVRNIYGTDITEFTDQIVKAGKIQGIWVSCGLHIHFSCEEVDELEVKRPVYEPVHLPLGFTTSVATRVADSSAEGFKETFNQHLLLYRYVDCGEEKVLKARASRLNKPTIKHIIRELDDAFFGKFAPEQDERTKYRQPGFYELKPYGFEYRSLPFTDEVEANLFDIVKKAFEILKDTNS